MTCDGCGHDSRVIDSRDSGAIVRRRRECLSPACKVRFTTYEVSAEIYSTTQFSAATVKKLVDLRSELGSILDLVEAELTP